MASWNKTKVEQKSTKFTNPTKDTVSKEDAHIELVKFSFKYLDTQRKEYTLGDRDSNYFLTVLERVSHVSRMTCAALRYPKVKALRNHFIDWEDTTQESFGIPNEEQLVEKPFQFGISANEHGRVIGFFISQTFYIVWFDPHHNTYSK